MVFEERCCQQRGRRRQIVINHTQSFLFCEGHRILSGIFSCSSKDNFSFWQHFLDTVCILSAPCVEKTIIIDDGTDLKSRKIL